MPDPKLAPITVNPIQIIAIISAVVAAASVIVPKLIGKTGPELRDAIITSLPDALPVVELVAGKDLLNDAKFREAVIALTEAFIDAPAKAGTTDD